MCCPPIDASCCVASGPFTVTLGDVDCSTGAARFRVELHSTDGTHVVWRRYSEFARLSADLLRHDDLPEMPPRSFFRKRMLPGFMDRRHRGLAALLTAAVAADPHCVQQPVLRAFLALPPVQDSFGDCASKVTEGSVSTGSFLSNSWCKLRLFPILESVTQWSPGTSSSLAQCDSVISASDAS